MKTFAEFLPSMTAREHEIVEAFDLSARRMEWPLDVMRATPPAKEPESVEGICAGYGLPSANRMLDVVRVLFDVGQDEALKANIQRGDKLIVIKEDQNHGQH